MLDEKNRTLDPHSFPAVEPRAGLIPLRMTLRLAESGSPSCPRRVDSDELLAMQLIARMQARYKKASPFLSPGQRFKRLVVGHAR